MAFWIFFSGIICLFSIQSHGVHTVLCVLPQFAFIFCIISKIDSFSGYCSTFKSVNFFQPLNSYPFRPSWKIHRHANLIIGLVPISMLVCMRCHIRDHLLHMYLALDTNTGMSEFVNPKFFLNYFSLAVFFRSRKLALWLSLDLFYRSLIPQTLYYSRLFT